MGRVARTMLSKLAPVLWTAAGALFTAHLLDPRFICLGLVCILSCMGCAGAICGAIEGTTRRDNAILLDTIARLTREADLRPVLRSVPRR